VGEGPQAALNKYQSQKDDIFAGRDPRLAKSEGYTVGKLCNEFLNLKKSEMMQGKLTARHFNDLYRSCTRFVAYFGAGRLVENIGLDDFEMLGFSYPDTWKLRRRKREIGAVRSVFSYAVMKEKIGKTRFGTFKSPSQDELAAERFGQEREYGNRAFTAEQLRRILDAATVPLKAMI
jgi:hypothetical protein